MSTRRQVIAAVTAFKYSPHDTAARELLMSTIDSYIEQQVTERAERLLHRTGFYKRAETPPDEQATAAPPSATVNATTPLPDGPLHIPSFLGSPPSPQCDELPRPVE